MLEPDDEPEELPKGRSLSRWRALQAIYQWQLNELPAHRLLEQFSSDGGLKRAHRELFETLLRDLVSHCEEIDQALQPFTDRPVGEIDPVELAILRLGAAELIHQPGVPYRVILNEYIELAKQFGSPTGHRYVNGVLDKLVAKVRAEERQTDQAAQGGQPAPAEKRIPKVRVKPRGMASAKITLRKKGSESPSDP